MAAIYTTRATERLSRKLEHAGTPYWIAVSTGDTWGKYLLFRAGGKCVAGCGWTLAEASAKVAELIAEHAGQLTRAE